MDYFITFPYTCHVLFGILERRQNPATTFQLQSLRYVVQAIVYICTHTTRHIGTCLLHDWTIKVPHKIGIKPIQRWYDRTTLSVKYSHCKKLRKKSWLIYELFIMRKTQEKIILYARFCHMHDVKKFKMLTISLTTMKFSLQPAPA